MGFHLGSGKPKTGAFTLPRVINIVRDLRTSVQNAGTFQQGYTNFFVGSNSPFSRLLAGPTNQSVSMVKKIPSLDRFVKDPHNIFPPGGGPPGGGGGG